MELVYTAFILAACFFGAFGQIVQIPLSPSKVVGGLSIAEMATADQEGKHVYISDRGQNVVKVFDQEGNQISTIDHGFNNPGGMAFSKTGSLYIADLYNNRIVVTTKEGWLLGTIGSSAVFNVPHDVEVGPDGLLYVAEWSNRRVHVLTLDGQSVKTIQVPGNPINVEFGTDGRMHVALPLQNKIVLFDTDCSQLEDEVNINYPIEIYIDSCGYIYVGGASPAQVRIFDESYTLLKTMSGFTSTEGRGIVRLGNKLYTTDWRGGKMYIF